MFCFELISATSPSSYNKYDDTADICAKDHCLHQDPKKKKHVTIRGDIIRRSTIYKCNRGVST